MPLNAHHLETFVVLMAIHYGFQDKFMLSLNLTKHRNKHFPNAPYLFSGVAGCVAIWLQERSLSDGLKSSVRQDCTDWIISPIKILGMFLRPNYSSSLLWAGTRGLPQGKRNFLNALSQPSVQHQRARPEKLRKRKKEIPPVNFCECAQRSLYFTSSFTVAATSKGFIFLVRTNKKIHQTIVAVVILC